jgi:Sigma-70 region 2
MRDYRLKSSDAELLVAARADPEAFGEFYRRNAIGVERWLRTQTPDLATAADLTAEAFAQALVGLDRFRGTSDEQAIAWLFGFIVAAAWSLRSAAVSVSSLSMTRRNSRAWKPRSTRALRLLICLTLSTPCPTANDKPCSCG